MTETASLPPTMRCRSAKAVILARRALGTTRLALGRLCAHRGTDCAVVSAVGGLRRIRHDRRNDDRSGGGPLEELCSLATTCRDSARRTMSPGRSRRSSWSMRRGVNPSRRARRGLECARRGSYPDGGGFERIGVRVKPSRCDAHLRRHRTAATPCKYCLRAAARRCRRWQRHVSKHDPPPDVGDRAIASQTPTPPDGR